MSKLTDVVAGALRFATAVTVGMLVVFVIICALFLVGPSTRTVSGLVYILGVPMVLIMAVRPATGKLTRLDKVAGTAAAAFSAATLAVAVVAALALVLTLTAAWSLSSYIGLAEPASAVLIPIATTSYFVAGAALLCAWGLAYAAYKIW
jgi:uncharacterized membrane protein